jgi:hypothetical protein
MSPTAVESVRSSELCWSCSISWMVSTAWVMSRHALLSLGHLNCVHHSRQIRCKPYTPFESGACASIFANPMFLVRVRASCSRPESKSFALACVCVLTLDTVSAMGSAVGKSESIQWSMRFGCLLDFFGQLIRPFSHLTIIKRACIGRPFTPVFRNRPASGFSCMQQHL